jgi:hypothetical protein
LGARGADPGLNRAGLPNSIAPAPAVTRAASEREPEENFFGDDPEPVQSVPQPAPSLPLPYLTPGGTLVIPLDSDPKYHWWKGGQSVKATMAEVQARMAAARASGGN